MLQKIKSQFRAIKDGEPGRRFIDQYERTRRDEGARGSFWKTFASVGVGVVLLICGLALSLPPGIPGFLLWIPGLALIAARWKYLSMMLDGMEAWARRKWEGWRKRRRP